MSDISAERGEGDPQQISIRSATNADFDTILALFNEGLGGSNDATELIRNNLTQTEINTKDGKQLLSFMSYVGDKPAGCVLVERLSQEELKERIDERLRSLQGVIPASMIEILRRKEETNYSYQALVPAFIIAEEFQNKPEVLFTMARHLLGMKENGRPFNFFAKLREDTMYRIITSKLLQKRIGDLGYSARELQVNGSTGHFVALEPLAVSPARRESWIDRGRAYLTRIRQRPR